MEMMDIEKQFLEETAPEQEGFVIDNLDKAAWAIDKIRLAKDEKAKYEVWVNDRIKQLQEWLADKTAGLDNDIERMTMLLQPFAEQMLAEQNGKSKKPKKTLSLPGAKLSFRAGAIEYNKDEEKLMDYVTNLEAEEAAKYVNVKTSLNWSELKKDLQMADDGVMVTKDGEIIEGVTWEKKEDSFTVKLED